MKKSCPLNWNEAETRSKCRGVTDFPVTSNRTRITYANIYCAQCNGDLDANADMLWPIVYNCYNNVSFSYSIQITSGTNDTTDLNITVWNIPYTDKFHYRYPVNLFDFVHSHFVPQALKVNDPYSTPTFIRTEHEYPATQLYEDGGDYICGMSFVLDHSIMRTCSETVSTCASDWTGGDMEELCLAYTDVYCDNSDLYRNPYCAVCNHVNLSQTFFCPVAQRPFLGGDFSDLVNWDITDHEMSPLQNDTSLEVEDGKITLIFTSIVHLRPMHGNLPRKQKFG
jgi:hypothetical protein